MREILVLTHSTHGNTLALAREIARGGACVEGFVARMPGVAPLRSASRLERAELVETAAKL